MTSPARSTNALDAYWMPFTPNREFKRNPRMIARAEGMYYFDTKGRKILDGAAGLWCANAGHCRKPIADAIARAAAELDYAPGFQFGHPTAFEAAARIAALAPPGLDHVFFANSGSEAADTALKIALAWHRVRGEGSRIRMIGRERGYHGVGFGGMSVGGILNNRKMFGPAMLPGVDHIRTTYDREHQRFSKGEPEYGAHFADELERLVTLHDASTIAAVIVEPMAGSTGVVPPPKGYLKRLREICTKHGILLIFDEVITGFGRLGAAFAAERMDVIPDMITFAKGVTSGAVPMGGVIASRQIYETFVSDDPKRPDQVIELFHGYTYSGHPLATYAAIATLDLYRDEGLFERARKLEPHFEEAVHSLKGHPLVADIRNQGLAAAVDIEPRPGAPAARGFETMKALFFEEDMMLRVAGDTMAFSPPLIVSPDEIDRLVAGLRRALDRLT
ncbi:MAG TPA: aspartate aminotransferase family protein [Micropepsaceae bacterium]|nr:aspartate aminotransferase family protein [Micropepsaceae bacterium]